MLWTITTIMSGEITFKKPEGIDRRYIAVRDVKKAQFTRNPDKPEAGVMPELDGTIQMIDNEGEIKKQA